jgi:hypothetical protein
VEEGAAGLPRVWTPPSRPKRSDARAERNITFTHFLWLLGLNKLPVDQDFDAPFNEIQNLSKQSQTFDLKY